MTWNLLVTRETDLLERYTRFEGYREMIGYPKRLRVRELLAVQRKGDGLTSVYISDAEQKRQLEEVGKDYLSSAYEDYQKVWKNIAVSIERAAEKLVSTGSYQFWEDFLAWYKKSRAAVFYTEMLNNIFEQKNEKSNIIHYGKIHDDMEKHSSVVWDRINPFFKAIAKRHDMQVEHLMFYLPQEFGALFAYGRQVPDDIIRQRIFYYVIFLKNEILQVYQGEDAKQKDQEQISAVAPSPLLDKVKGKAAWRGIVRGRVRIVNTKKQMLEMKEGEVLVSAMTTVRLMPAVRKAAAIITDEGGLTCHAAIVSREFNIPCIVGTKIATKVLKDGDKIEVDANNGLVKIINS